jgi:hypothetical protein
MAKIDYWQEFLDSIERGKKGYNKGIPIGLPKFSNKITNVQQRKYITIGGSTGSGKTAFVDNQFVLEPFEYLESNVTPFSLEVIYYCLEIPVVEKITKLVAAKIARDYGIVVSSAVITSERNNDIPPEIEDIIHSYKDYFKKILNKVIHFRGSLTPNYLYKDIMGYAEARGQIIRDNKGIIVNYIPHNPQLITQIIIDHSNLITPNEEDKNSKKTAIDRASQMLVFFRNMFNFSPIVVSQYNRGIEGMDRKKQESQEPQLSDFKETGSTQEDANLVLGLFYPYKFGIDTHRGYPVSKLGNNYRSLHILKNRNGEDNIALGLRFDGKTGRFSELPTMKDIKANPEALNKILKEINDDKTRKF